MINLIPKEEKRKMKVDFYFRIATLFLITLDCCAFIAFIALLPSYFLSSVKENLANSKISAQNDEPVPTVGEQSLSIAKGVNSKISLVETAEKNQFLLSTKIINTVIFKKGPNIKINRISYDNSTNQGKKVTINGTASSREALLFFRDTLASDPNVKNVNLPVSNFVKGTDIDFNITLTPS